MGTWFVGDRPSPTPWRFRWASLCGGEGASRRPPTPATAVSSSSIRPRLEFKRVEIATNQPKKKASNALQRAPIFQMKHIKLFFFLKRKRKRNDKFWLKTIRNRQARLKLTMVTSLGVSRSNEIEFGKKLVKLGISRKRLLGICR